MLESIFRFFFKYPAVAYSRGQLTLASGWPAWVLVAAIVVGAALVGVYLWRLKPRPSLPHGALVWGVEFLTLAILLLLLWRPSLILSTVLPQQNVVAVLVDDSASMAMAGTGTPRVEQVREALGPDSEVMAAL